MQMHNICEITVEKSIGSCHVISLCHQPLHAIHQQRYGDDAVLLRLAQDFCNPRIYHVDLVKCCKYGLTHKLGLLGDFAFLESHI